MTNSQSPVFSRSRAAANLEKYILEDRLVIGAWKSTDAQGREVGCLLHALGGGELDIRRADQCPSSVMPRWLAEFVPSAFDAAGEHNKMTVAKLFHETLTVSDSFGDAEWERVHVEFKARLFEQAVRFVEQRSKDLPVWEQVVTACSAVCAALRSGDEKALKEARKLLFDADAAPTVACYAALTAYTVSTVSTVSTAYYNTVAAPTTAAARLEQFQILLDVVKQVKNSKM